MCADISARGYKLQPTYLPTHFNIISNVDFTNLNFEQPSAYQDMIYLPRFPYNWSFYNAEYYLLHNCKRIIFHAVVATDAVNRIYIQWRREHVFVCTMK